MKVDFALPQDGAVHRICLRCHADGVERLKQAERIVYHCNSCGYTDGRSLYWGADSEWVAADGELWHDAAAVFVHDAAGRILLYERTEYPYGFWTVPAGHIDRGEPAKAAAGRELHEEVGIKALGLRHAITLDVPGSPCSAGADTHRWHVYVEAVRQPVTVTITDEEGRHPVWLTPAEALQLNLLPPVRRVLEILDFSAERGAISRTRPAAALAR